MDILRAETGRVIHWPKDQVNGMATLKSAPVIDRMYESIHTRIASNR